MKTKLLIYGYNAGPPVIYTVLPYCVVWKRIKDVKLFNEVKICSHNCSLEKAQFNNIQKNEYARNMGRCTVSLYISTLYQSLSLLHYSLLEYTVMNCSNTYTFPDLYSQCIVDNSLAISESSCNKR